MERTKHKRKILRVITPNVNRFSYLAGTVFHIVKNDKGVIRFYEVYEPTKKRVRVRKSAMKWAINNNRIIGRDRKIVREYVKYGKIVSDNLKRR